MVSIEDKLKLDVTLGPLLHTLRYRPRSDPFNTDRTPNKKEEFLEQRQAEVDAVVSAIGTLPESQNVTIYIDGHTDTQASYEYNRDLSRRRAEKIESMLRQRVDFRNFKLAYFGERNLAVPTIDEIDELGNRRVEIFLCSDTLTKIQCQEPPRR